jgi:WD40 repeat protein
MGYLFGGEIVNRAVRWSLLLMAAWSIACISVPLPSGGPELEKITLPVAGDEASTVRQTFGEPQRLDIPGYWLYEWTSDRKFVIVPVMPTGMPAGAAVAGNRYRMLVEIGPEERVSRVACTAREAPEDGLPPLDCETPIEPLRSRARMLFAYHLDGKPEFQKIKFNQSGGTGASTPMVLSADGRLLATTDSKNRLWVLDTETGEPVHRHEGEPIKFFSLAPVGQVKAAIADGGRRLVIAQHKIGVEILERAPNGKYATTVSVPDVETGQVAAGGDDRTIFAFGAHGISAIQPDGSRTPTIEPVARLDFHVNGPEHVEPPAGQDEPIAVRLGQSWWTGGRTALFTADGRGLTVLDLRNDYARVGKQGYGFSPDGRLLAHNTGRHLEVWQSAELLGVVEGRHPASTASPSWVALMPFTNRKDDEPTAHMPVAFRDDGKLLAAASRVTIHVWRAENGEAVALIGAMAQDYDPQSKKLAFRQATADSWPVFQVLALALAPDNRLTAVFSDSSFNIYIGAWQIEE